MAETYERALKESLEAVARQAPEDEIESLFAKRRDLARALSSQPSEMISLLERRKDLREFFSGDYREAIGKGAADPASTEYEEVVKGALRGQASAPLRRDEDTPANRWLLLQKAWTNECRKSDPDAKRIAILRDKQREVAEQVSGSPQDIAVIARESGLPAARAALSNPAFDETTASRLDGATRSFFTGSAAAQAALANGEFEKALTAEADVEKAIGDLRAHPLGYAYVGRASNDKRSARLTAEEVASTGRSKVDDFGTKKLQDLVDERLKASGADIDTSNRFIALTEIEQEFARNKDVAFRPYAKALGFAYAKEIGSDPDALSKVMQADPAIAKRAALMKERAGSFESLTAIENASSEPQQEKSGAPREQGGREKDKGKNKEKARDEAMKASMSERDDPGYQITKEASIFAERVDQAVAKGYQDRVDEADRQNLSAIPKKENKHLIRLVEEFTIHNDADLTERMAKTSEAAMGAPLNAFPAGGHVTKAVSRAAKENPDAIRQLYRNTMMLRDELQKDVDFGSEEMKVKFDNLEMGRRVLAHGMAKAKVAKIGDFDEDYRAFQSSTGRGLPKHLCLEPDCMKAAELARKQERGPRGSGLVDKMMAQGGAAFRAAERYVD